MPVQTRSGNGKYRASHCIWKLMVGMEMHGTGYSCRAVGNSEVTSTTAPYYLWLQAKVISTGSPTLLAASKSKSCFSQAGLASLRGEPQLITSLSAKKGAMWKDHRTTAVSRCPPPCWTARTEGPSSPWDVADSWQGPVLRLTVTHIPPSSSM